MRRTLFIIPDSIGGLPLFGFGILFALLLVSFALWSFRIHRNPSKKLSTELQQNGLLWGIATAVIVFVLPMIELKTLDGQPLGIAIRGYGLFLLIGVGTGLGLAIYRSGSRGFKSEDVLGLATWVFVSAIVGARLFYIIEYRESFLTGDLATTLRKMLDFTRGGLVVYGSIIGGAFAVIAYCRRHKISALRMGDVVIPALFLGLFFGRIGCLMNGCCYGGRCEEGVWALHFPPGSPVYSQQTESGEVLGIQWESNEDASGKTANESMPWPRKVKSVTPGTIAAKSGIHDGMMISRIEPTLPPESEMKDISEDDTSQLGLHIVANGTSIFWDAKELPQAALPVRPSQIISSLSGLTICIFLLLLSRIPTLPDGILTGIGIATYAAARFGEEMVRSDEPGQFGTNLSISQWISLLIFPIAIFGIGYIYLTRRRSTQPGDSGQP